MIRKSLLTIVALAFSAMALQAEDAKEISLAELKKAIADKKVCIIDVNGSTSWKAGHIPGAIDFVAAKDDLAKKLPDDKETLVVSYCGGPQCGAHKKASSKALALGYKNVKFYKGGISGWKASGEKTEKG